MNLVLVIFAICLSTLAHARPQGKNPPGDQIAIISQQSNQEADGGYQWSFETANGIKAQEVGRLKKATSADASDVIVAEGSSSYTSPEGVVINLTYVADDEKGFVPVGDHLPTPPPVPEAIQKAVDYLLSLPPQSDSSGGRGKRSIRMRMVRK